MIIYTFLVSITLHCSFCFNISVVGIPIMCNAANDIGRTILRNIWGNIRNINNCVLPISVLKLKLLDSIKTFIIKLIWGSSKRKFVSKSALFAYVPFFAFSERTARGMSAVRTKKWLSGMIKWTHRILF